MRAIFKNKCGAAYVENAIGLFAILMVASLVLGVFKFFTLRVEMDRIAEELLEAATFSGCFGTDFEERAEELKTEHFDFEVEYGADAYFNSSLKQVQLGERMWVRITISTTLSGAGIRLPMTLPVLKSGLSERYWK